MNTAARRIALLMVALLIVAVPPIEGSSSGKHSQAASGCTCHNNGNNGMSATHNFTTTYMPGIIYSIGINLNGGSQSFNGGFNVVVDKGTLMNPGPGVQINTPTSDSATHTSRGQLGWDFEWMAPNTGSGTVTVEIAVLQADASNTNAGDSWDRLTVTIPEFTPPPPPNDPPEASNVAVTPSPEARTDADLSVAYDYADNDSDPESGTTIKWYVDGTVNTAHNGKSTIDSSSTQPGQKWKAEVTPSDGTDAGAPVMSNEITIIDIDSDNDGVLDGQDQFAHAVTVGVVPFVRVVGELVLAVQDAVVVRVDVDDGDLVAHDGRPGVAAIVWRHLGLPLLAGLGGRGIDGGLPVVGGVDGPVNVPFDGGARFGVAVVVGVIVSQGEVGVGSSLGRWRHGHVGGFGRVVGRGRRRELGNGHRQAVPRVARITVVSVGLEHGDFHRHGSAAGVGGHPFKVPAKLTSAGVGCAVAGSVDLNPGAGVHEGPFVNHDVEAAVEGLRTAVDVNADGVNDARHVRGREVVRGAHAVVVVGVTGAAASGLAVLS